MSQTAHYPPYLSHTLMIFETTLYAPKGYPTPGALLCLPASTILFQPHPYYPMSTCRKYRCGDGITTGGRVFPHPHEPPPLLKRRWTTPMRSSSKVDRGVQSAPYDPSRVTRYPKWWVGVGSSPQGVVSLVRNLGGERRGG
eukprot:758113-Hanusia_phi.AAC.5